MRAQLLPRPRTIGYVGKGKKKRPVTQVPTATGTWPPSRRQTWIAEEPLPDGRRITERGRNRVGAIRACQRNVRAALAQ